MKDKLPVLLIGYNRPDRFKLVLAEILKYNPKILYISIDGPKDEMDYTKIEIIKSIIKKIPSNLDKKIRIHESNVGCEINVTTSISWMFESEKSGIILEDDCLPHPFFFNYCNFMLTKFELNKKIHVISGFNYDLPRFSVLSNYFTSSLISTWGWATWKDRWENFSFESCNKSVSNVYSVCNDIIKDEIPAEYIGNMMMKKTWDLCFMYEVWLRKGLTILPKYNLIQNIGFGPDSTHTTEINHPLGKVEFSKKGAFSLFFAPIRLSHSTKHDSKIIYEKLIYSKKEHVFKTKYNLFKKNILMILKKINLIG
jgi:hypothetical protein